MKMIRQSSRSASAVQFIRVGLFELKNVGLHKPSPGGLLTPRRSFTGAAGTALLEHTFYRCQSVHRGTAEAADLYFHKATWI